MYDPMTVLVYVAAGFAALALLLMVFNAIERRLGQIVGQENGVLAKDMALLLGEVRTLVSLAREGLFGRIHQDTPPPTAKHEDVSAQLREVSGQLRDLRHQLTQWAAEKPVAPAETRVVVLPAPTAPVAAEPVPAPEVAAPPVVAVAPAPEPVAPPVVVAAPPPEPVMPVTAPAPAPVAEAAPEVAVAPPPPEPANARPLPTSDYLAELVAPRQPQPNPVPARLLDAVLSESLSPSLVYLQEHAGRAGAEQEVPGGSQAVAKLLSLQLARADEGGVYLTDAGRDIANLLISVGK